MAYKKTISSEMEKSRRSRQKGIFRYQKIQFKLNYYVTIVGFTHDLCVISDLTYIITHKNFV